MAFVKRPLRWACRPSGRIARTCVNPFDVGPMSKERVTVQWKCTQKVNKLVASRLVMQNGARVIIDALVMSSVARTVRVVIVKMQKQPHLLGKNVLPTYLVCTYSDRCQVHVLTQLTLTYVLRMYLCSHKAGFIFNTRI